MYRAAIYSEPLHLCVVQFQLAPLLWDQSYLEEQHILIAVKTADGMESYGECVLGLQDRFSIAPTQFQATLTHNGEVTGTIK